MSRQTTHNQWVSNRCYIHTPLRTCEVTTAGRPKPTSAHFKQGDGSDNINCSKLKNIMKPHDKLAAALQTHQIKGVSRSNRALCVFLWPTETDFQPGRRSTGSQWRRWWSRGRWRTCPMPRRQRLLRWGSLRCFPLRCGSSTLPWWSPAWWSENKDMSASPHSVNEAELKLLHKHGFRDV